MFNGEQIVMQKERLTRDNKFLLRNGVIPWIPRASADFAHITRDTAPRVVRSIASDIVGTIFHYIPARSPHEIRLSYRADWNPADIRFTRTTIEELCENLFTQIKAYDVSREMFAFRLQVFDELLPFVSTRRKTIVDIQSGISTRLGDGQRHYDGNGQWSFSQMKGLRTHTGHLYIRGDRV